MESILNSIKKLLGIEPDDDSFDQELVMHVNTVFTLMTQLGLGPTDGFFITDATAKWTDYNPTRKDLEMMKHVDSVNSDDVLEMYKFLKSI